MSIFCSRSHSALPENFIKIGQKGAKVVNLRVVQNLQNHSRLIHWRLINRPTLKQEITPDREIQLVKTVRDKQLHWDAPSNKNKDKPLFLAINNKTNHAKNRINSLIRADGGGGKGRLLQANWHSGRTHCQVDYFGALLWKYFCGLI